jgi:nicotinamidase-related amidase
MKTKNDTVLVVIDMQNGFLNDRSRHVIPRVIQTVEEFRKRDIPVVFTRFHNAPNSQYERLIGWTRLRSSPEVDLINELEQYANVIIDKNVYSAFAPSFAQLVQEKGWTNIVLCGVATDGCVLKTAVDAFERELTPIIIEDACSSHAGEEVHKAGLLLLGRFIGKRQIMGMEDVLKWIDGY